MRGIGKIMVKTARQAARLALLPLLEASEEALMGGQAVIEGVMMRAPHAYAVAVRCPSGSIALAQDYLERPSEKHRWLKVPVLRGLGTLGQALVLGVRALRYSAEQAAAESPAAEPPDAAAPRLSLGAVSESRTAPAAPEKTMALGGWLLALNIAFSVGFFIVFYKFLPLYLATLLKRRYAVAENVIAFNFIDGVIRLGLFLGFLFVIAQWKEIQRVFEYHGAEHKVVWAFEQGQGLEVASARACSRFHPRCGTSFLLVVMALAILMYLFLPFRSFAGRLAGRIVLLPVIAGVSYEFIRYAAKSRGRLWKWASRPGLWLQRVTTREPDDRQLETAIRALEKALELERARGGELVVA